MATRIECINKQPREDPHKRIESIGGEGWTMSVADAIEGIESGKLSFFVHTRERTTDVIVGEHDGHKYLKTVADGYVPDNLLSLPECP